MKIAPLSANSFKMFVDKFNQIYKKFVEAYPHYFFETIENNKAILNKIVRPTFIEDQSTTEDYIKWYIDLRIAESEVGVSQSVVDKTLLNAKQLYWLSTPMEDAAPLKIELRNKLSQSIEYMIGTPLFRRSSQLTGGSKGGIFLDRAIE